MTDRRPPVFNAPPATLALCAALAAAWGAAELLGGGFVDWPGLMLDSADPFGPALLGHVFLHAGFGHLLANAGMTLAFASAVERRFGAAAMLGIYAASAAAGGLAFAALAGGADGAQLIGASGAAHGAGGAAAVVLRSGGRERARRAGAALLWFMAGINLALALLGDTVDLFGFRIGWQAHLGGLAAGTALAALLSRRRR